MIATKKSDVWRDQPQITVAEAALVFGRSESWIRDRLDDRSLTRREGRPIGVATDSVARLLESLRERRIQEHKRRPHLRLVVNNP